MGPASKEPVGLRERKKAKTRAAIQQAALSLFIEQGYESTTVEQIAAAAEVSQSTFFRYFPTKEETVLYDQLDPVLMASFVKQPAELSPLAAVRAAVRDVFHGLSAEEVKQERARQRLIVEVRELRARVLEQFGEGIGLLTDALAERLGRKPDEFAYRVWAGALVGVVYAAYFAAMEDPDVDAMDYVDAGIAQLESGLPL